MIKSVMIVVALLVGAVTHAQTSLIPDGTFEGLSTGLSAPGTPVTIGGWTFENYAGIVANGGQGFYGNPGQFVRLESNGSPTNDPTATRTASGLTVGAMYILSWDFALRIPYSGGANGPSFGVFRDSQTFA